MTWTNMRYTQRVCIASTASCSLFSSLLTFFCFSPSSSLVFAFVRETIIPVRADERILTQTRTIYDETIMRSSSICAADRRRNSVQINFYDRYFSSTSSSFSLSFVSRSKIAYMRVRWICGVGVCVCVHCTFPNSLLAISEELLVIVSNELGGD